MKRKTSAGGAATASGMDFQHHVAAWVATYILGEKDAIPPWGLPVDTVLEFLRCETEQPVDDLLVGTSKNGLVFAQIKRTVHLSKAENSYLASALDQFVRQFVSCQSKTVGTQPWERPLDPMKDRFVLITSSASSKPIQMHLENLFRRIRELQQHQMLDDVAKNNNERRALTVARSHITKSWQKSKGVVPSDDELRQLCSLIRVHVMNLDGGGTNEREAKNLLRTEVLKDPDQTDAAWTRLVSLCARLAAQRSGADRLSLQRELLEAGIQLQVPRSYQDDIEKLRNFSETTFDAIAHLAQIRVGSTTIKIQRSCTQALRKAIEDNSILVVGQPGAGKSGALHDLVSGLRQDCRDYVFLAVDRIAARSLGELRTEIGLAYEFTKVLNNWPGTQPAFLVIDALDAARADPAGVMIRDLIRKTVEKAGRWRIVASIRKFDLRYGIETKGLFTGLPPTEFQDHEFRDICHLEVPVLSADEFSQIAQQSMELYELVGRAASELRDLLRVAFNLRLMAELLGAGMAAHELTPIRTQLELLDRYWSYRIIRQDSQGDAREDVLRRLCQKMVEAKSLRIDRSGISEPGDGNHLCDLLSSQVLIEWKPSHDALPDRYILAFSHHVLFDYAIARLLLRGTIESVVHKLVTDPELVVAVRPSLLLHFRHLWTADSNRRQFWDLVFRIGLADRIPEIGKLIGPSVAAELVTGLPDLEPLFVALGESSSANYTAAEQALRHLTGALLAGAPGEVPLVGQNASPWCQILERVSRALESPVAYTVRSLLSTICERSGDFTLEQRDAAGHTARRLLEFAWSHSPRDQWLVIHALEAVCRTFESDLTASAALIRRCLEHPHLSQFGFEEMPWLAREIKRLIDVDPALCEEIYRVAFTHSETSEEKTQMGTGGILALTSNRRQDYGMALYELAEAFPAFLEHAPVNATRALIAVTEAYVAQHHPTSSGEVHEEVFDFNGRQARFRTDYSSIWDRGDTYGHDKPLEMLDTFQKYLERLAEQSEAVEGAHNLVQLLVSENHLAVLWRRVLVVATRYPNTLGKKVLPLAWAIPILTGYDTTTLAGEFLKAIFPMLDRSERECIELALLNIPGTYPQERREAGETVQNRLLGCLIDADLVTEEARLVLEQLKARNAIPSNEPPVHFESWSGTYGEEEYLREQGVPIDEEANREIRKLERPVKEFADKHLNTKPNLEEISTVLPALQTLHEALSRADADGVHPKQRDNAWGCLAAACGRIARSDEFSCEKSADVFVKNVLLEGSHSVEPVHDPKYDEQFDKHPSWGSPAARIEAAEGLIVLARHSACSVPDVLEAIVRLSCDSEPAVRYQIARSLNALYRTAPQLMWQLVERISQEEQSRGVLQGLLTGPFHRLAGADPDRVADLAGKIFDRVREGPGAETVRGFCVGIFAGLCIWRNHPHSRGVILEIAGNPAAYPEEVLRLLGHLREPLTHGRTDPHDSEADAIRRRAFDLLEQLLQSGRGCLADLEARHTGTPANAWPEQDQEVAKSLLHLIDGIGHNIYFASGAHDKRQTKSPTTRTLKPESKRFYQEAASIFDGLAEAGLPSVTHHLLETLSLFVPVDPRGVFLRVGQVVQAGQKGGYQYESLAANLMVMLVERYLAEYRPLLREDGQCRQTLIELLDVFVQAGWPSARRLTYRLEEIFR